MSHRHPSRSFVPVALVALLLCLAVLAMPAPARAKATAEQLAPPMWWPASTPRTPR